MEIFVQRASRVAEHIPAARSRRTFLAALADFERMLTVPLDYPRGCFSETDAEALRRLADTVIASIERRLDARVDRAAVERQLVAAIYRIRADVEAVYTRCRYDAAGNPARNAVAAPAVSRPR
jgi:hypothetical protein